ncbi:MAG TPA: hypothetical protein VFX25_34510 [Streptosporangiaceae bacterium]|nr:hypothetical protein [Streptosporangiaceae bacterium]
MHEEDAICRAPGARTGIGQHAGWFSYWRNCSRCSRQYSSTAFPAAVIPHRSPVRVPILAHLAAIDAELAGRDARQP